MVVFVFSPLFLRKRYSQKEEGSPLRSVSCTKRMRPRTSPFCSKKEKKSIFRVSVATLNVFFFLSLSEKSRGHATDRIRFLSLCRCFAVFDRSVGVLNTKHRLPRVLPGRSFGLFFSSVLPLLFFSRRSSSNISKERTNRI